MPPAKPSPAGRAVLRHLTTGDRLIYRDERPPAGWWLETDNRRVRLTTVRRLLADGWLAADATAATEARYILSRAGRVTLRAQPLIAEPPTPSPTPPESQRPDLSPRAREEIKRFGRPLPARFGEARTVQAMLKETWRTMTDDEKEIARRFFEENR